jgi:zinc protease
MPTYGVLAFCPYRFHFSLVTRFRSQIATFAALLCLLSGVSATLVSAQRVELERVIKRTVLRNGLEVIAVENHGIPIATVELNVKNGAFTQRPEYEGLAHMYEHMFFKASKQFPNAEAFGQRAAELGARYNGTTQEERVNYYLTLPSDSVKGGMSLIAAAVRAPLFLPTELAQEKQVVLGEYDRNEASPGFAIQQRMSAALYPGESSRKNTIGDRTILSTVTPEKMRFIQSRYYVPNNMALIVTGDITPAQVFSYADSLLGDWPRGPDPFQLEPIPLIPPLPGASAIIGEAEVGAVTVLIQWQGPSVRRDRAATYAADVFSDALNTKGSRFQRLLTDSGLWTAIGVNYYTLDQVGPITISGQTTPERLKEALAVLWREIEKLDDPGYFSATELQSVKAQRGTDNQFGIEKTSELTHTIGFWWAVADLDYFLGYVDNMARQTPADLQRYAARFIVGKPSVTGVLLSREDRAGLRLTEADVVGPVKGAKVTP